MIHPNPGPGHASYGGGGGGADIINEGFEGTGTPSGWTSFVSLSGAVNFDYTTSPLVGSQSMSVSAASAGDVATSRYSAGGTLNHTEIWGKVTVRVDVASTGFNQGMFIADGSGTPQAQVYTDPTRHLHIFDQVGGAIDLSTTDTLTIGTVYDVWFHYKKGTGANGILTGSFATTGSARPNSGTAFVTGTNGAFTANAAQLDFKANTALVIVFDAVQVASTDIF